MWVCIHKKKATTTATDDHRARKITCGDFVFCVFVLLLLCLLFFFLWRFAPFLTVCWCSLCLFSFVRRLLLFSLRSLLFVLLFGCTPQFSFALLFSFPFLAPLAFTIDEKWFYPFCFWYLTKRWVQNEENLCGSKKKTSTILRES